jgi:hypothetical protein
MQDISFALKLEAAGYSETLILSARLCSATSQKTISLERTSFQDLSQIL